MTLLPHAIAAVQQGFHVFPVEPLDKTPHKVEPDKPWTIRWSEAATNDIAKIAEWWSWSPQANIGIAAKQSQLLVVDCDVHDDGRDGTIALLDLCIEHSGSLDQLDETYQIQTGSGGIHLYFRWPPHIQASQASPIKGVLDIRCNGGERGGYVLGAGSVTAKGTYAPLNDAPILDCPPWLMRLCTEQPRQPKPEPVFAQPRRTGGTSGLVRTVLDAPDGNRNNALHWAARAACADGVDIEKAIDELGQAYADCYGDGGQRQAESTIRSAYRNQSRKEGL